MQQNQKQFRVITLLSDTSGTGVWRHIAPINAINCIANDIGILNTYTQVPILDQNYYNGVSQIRVQRWISPDQLNVFKNFFKPLMDRQSGWLVYEIDDAMGNTEIPLFNRGRKPFADVRNQNAIREMLNTADFVIVTTQRIKQYYHERYGVSLDNIICVPNLLPRTWIDDYYRPEVKMSQFSKNKARPRVGFISSLSHFNIDGIRRHIPTNEAAYPVRENEQIVKWVDQNNQEIPESDTEIIKDDFHPYIELIKRTIKDYKWVFCGYCPPELEQYVKSGDIEVHRGVQILNYPSMIYNLGLQVVVAPLENMVFNECKSPIKYLECSAIGVPLLAQNMLPYTTCMPENMLFNTAEELGEKLKKIKYMSSGAYQSLIEYNWKYINSPHVDGDFNLKNYWLEDNIGIWIELSKMRQKMLPISLKNVYEQIKAKKMQEKTQTLQTSESGEATIVI